MDVIDRAQQQEQWLRDQALARARNTESGPSASHCEACDDAIPEPRRQAVPGVRLCVICQQRKEAGYGR